MSTAAKLSEDVPLTVAELDRCSRLAHRCTLLADGLGMSIVDRNVKQAPGYANQIAPAFGPAIERVGKFDSLISSCYADPAAMIEVWRKRYRHAHKGAVLTAGRALRLVWSGLGRRRILPWRRWADPRLSDPVLFDKWSAGMKGRFFDPIYDLGPFDNLNETTIESLGREFAEMYDVESAELLRQRLDNEYDLAADKLKANVNESTPLDDNAWWTHIEFSERFGIGAEAARKKLDRWRNTNPNQVGRGFQENSDRRGRKPGYSYLIGAVRHLFE